MYKNKPLNELSNDELAAAMKELSLNIGPITSTTRRVYENRLRSYLSSRNQSQENTNHDLKDKRSDNSKDVNKESQKMVVCNGFHEASEIEGSSSDLTVLPKTEDDSQIENSNKFDNDSKPDDDVIVAVKPESNGNNKPGIYYGVWLPFIPKADVCQVPLVFRSQTDALRAMKGHKGSRFKSFSSKEEAKTFSLSKLPQLSVDKLCAYVANHVEQQNQLKTVPKAPSFQELMKYRRGIEENDLTAVQVCLSNPKYLISSSDIPVVLQEGARLNAVHICVKYNKLEMLNFILNTLRSSEFLKQMYQDATEEQLEFRKHHLLDLYLNTPEKILCDTPLHMACKFGFVDIVRYLLDNEEVNVNAVNKDGNTAGKVVCHRVNAKGELKVKFCKQITRLLEDKAYIPLFDLESESKVGEPVISRSPKALRKANHKVKAFAGPMSVDKANIVYEKWKKSPRTNKEHGNILKSDFDKGLERIGRIISAEEKVPFIEYWSFLHCYTTLNTPTGLAKLEAYLRSKNETLKSERKKKRQSSSAPKISNKQKLLAENGDSEIKRKLSFDDSPRKNENSSLTETSSLPTISSDKIKQALCNGYIEKKLDKGISCSDFEYRCKCNRLLENCEKCSIEIDLKNLTAAFKTCSLTRKQIKLDKRRTKEIRVSKSNLTKPRSSSLLSQKSKLKDGFSNGEKDLDISGISIESAGDFSCSEDVTNNKLEDSVFIYGSFPSKQDVDVLRAMGNMTCDPMEYPFITRWKRYMESFPKTTINSWPSPSSPRYRKTVERKSLLWTA